MMSAQETLKGTHGTAMKNTQWMKRLRAFGAQNALARWCRKHGLAGECGAELVEFAFTAMLYLVFCIGFLELCMVLFYLHCIGEASRQTARWASVRGTASSVSSGTATTCVNPNISTCPAAVSDVQAYGQSQPGMNATNTVVAVNWCNSDGTTGCTNDPSNAQPGHIVKVTVTYKFARVPFVSGGAFNFTSSAEKVIWQ